MKSDAPAQPPAEVRHNAAASRYEVRTEGLLSIAEYMRAGDAMIFTHTLVPEKLRGHGIAEALVRAALADARRDKLRVVPHCSYVRRFIQKHPELVERAG